MNSSSSSPSTGVSNALSVLNVYGWKAALQSLDAGDTKGAIRQFSELEPQTSKILYNVGSLILSQEIGPGDESSDLIRKSALDAFIKSTSLDSFFAMGHFQCGYIFEQLGNAEEAMKSYLSCIEGFRGSKIIDYEQLGIDIKLCVCEAYFNVALVYMKDPNSYEEGMRSLLLAADSIVLPRHERIELALRDRQERCNPFSIRDSLIFRPSSIRLLSIDEKEAATSDAGNTYVDTFSTPMKLYEAKKKADDDQRLLCTAALKAASSKDFRLVKIITGKNKCRYAKWKIESNEGDDIYESLMRKVDGDLSNWHFKDDQGDWAQLSCSDELEIALEILKDKKSLTITRLN